MGKVSQSFGLLALISVATALSTVNLKTAGNYAILSQTGITTTGVTQITGHIAVSPASSASLTGFGLTLSSDGTKSSSPAVVGDVFAASYGSPTPATLTTAISDLTAAYNDAAGRINPDFLDTSAGNLIDSTLNAGLYKFNSALTFGGVTTVYGSATDIFIFQTSGALNFNAGSKVVLSGGALAQNVFYVAAGQVTLGGTAEVQGVILGKTSIVFGSGAKLVKGRALAQTAVTLIANTITSP